MEYNFSLTQGDDFTFGFKVKDSDGVYVELSTALITCQGRYGNHKGQLAFTASTDNGLITVVDNTATMKLGRDITVLLSPSIILYDIKILTGDIRDTVLFGSIDVEAEVTTI